MPPIPCKSRGCGLGESIDPERCAAELQAQSGQPNGVNEPAPEPATPLRKSCYANA